MRSPSNIPIRDWESSALCARFPDFGRSSVDDQVQVCASCPVRDECLELGRDVAEALGSVVVECHDQVYDGRTLPELASKPHPLVPRPKKGSPRDWVAICALIEQMAADDWTPVAISEAIGYPRPSDLRYVLRQLGHTSTADLIGRAS